MRRIITMTLMSLGLTGGVALADNHGRGGESRAPRTEQRNNGFQRGMRDNRDVRQDRRDIREDRRDIRDDRAEHFRDYNRRPALRFERHEDYAGFRFVAGQWQWDGYEWNWVPGHYVHAYR